MLIGLGDTPTVVIKNLSRPGTPVSQYWVGDTYQIDIDGGPPNTTLQSNGYALPSALDSTGHYMLRGTFASKDLGVQSWEFRTYNTELGSVTFQVSMPSFTTPVTPVTSTPAAGTTTSTVGTTTTPTVSADISGIPTWGILAIAAGVGYFLLKHK